MLEQISECSNGFVMIVLNDQNGFEVYENLPNQVSHLAMAQFLALFSEQRQEILRTKTFNLGKELSLGAYNEEDREEGDEGEDKEDEEDGEDEGKKT